MPSGKAVFRRPQWSGRSSIHEFGLLATRAPTEESDGRSSGGGNPVRERINCLRKKLDGQFTVILRISQRSTVKLFSLKCYCSNPRVTSVTHSTL